MSVLYRVVNVLCSAFAIYLIVYATFLFLSVIIGANTMYARRRRGYYENRLDVKSFIPISIIVPAYNEEVTIIETVRSLLALDYDKYEIVVVDDGSKDNTSKVLIEHFGMQPVIRPIRSRIPCQPVEQVYECYDQKVSITLIRKKNGGKADALNMGINASYYSYFICMDADSVLQYDSLRKIVAPILENDKIVACGGAVMLCNGVTLKDGKVIKYDLPKNIIACMQAVEYSRTFLASRLLFDRFNGNLIISGAFGLFKKDTVIAAGGYDHDTKGEDMELVVKLHEFCVLNKIDYTIKYAPDAICWTQAPERLRDLRTQRKRWHVGLFQCMYKYRNFFANPKMGPVATISYLYFLLYELLSPYIELLGLALSIVIVALGIINVRFAVVFFFVYVLYGMILSITSYLTTIHLQGLSIKPVSILKIIGLSLLETTYIHFVMLWTRATALVGYRKNKRNWGTIQRKKIDNS